MIKWWIIFEGVFGDWWKKKKVVVFYGVMKLFWSVVINSNFIYG